MSRFLFRYLGQHDWLRKVLTIIVVSNCLSSFIRADEIRTRAQSLVINNNITEAAENLWQLYSSTSTSASSSLTLLAIGATVKALRAAHASIESQNFEEKHTKQLFEQEYITGTATYFVPANIIDRNDEQNHFKDIIKYIAAKGARLYSFAKIRGTVVTTLEKCWKIFCINSLWRKYWPLTGTSYSIISLATLFESTGYESAVGDDDSALEDARRSCDLFIRAKLPNMLETIQNFKSYAYDDDSYQKKRFLRFLTLLCSNMLMAVQCFPGNDDQASITLAISVEGIVDDLLLSKQFSYIRNEMDLKDEFANYLTSLRREVEALKLGYTSKVLNSISLDNVIGQGDGILQALNSMWHQILFFDNDHSQPDDLMYMVRCLTRVLYENRDDQERFLKRFTNGSSVMDLIGDFSSMNPSARKVILSDRELVSHHGTEISELTLFSKNFIAPLIDLITNKRFSQGSTKISEFGEAITTNWFGFEFPKQINSAVFQQVNETIFRLIALSIESTAPFLPEQPFGEQLYKRCMGVNREKKSLFDSLRSSLCTKKNGQQQLKLATINKLDNLLSATYEFLDAVRYLDTLHVLLDKHHEIIINRSMQELLNEKLGNLSVKGNYLQATMSDLFHTVIRSDKIARNIKKGPECDHNKRRRVILTTLKEDGVLQKRVNVLVEEIDRIQDKLVTANISEITKNKTIGDIHCLLARSLDHDRDRIKNITATFFNYISD